MASREPGIPAGMALGDWWGFVLQHADRARGRWRRIVWQVRDHYDGLGLSDLAQPVPFNLHRAVEDGIIAALRPRGLEFQLEADRAEEQEDARSAQGYVNWVTRATELTSDAKPFVTAGRNDGLGILKVEYGGPWTPMVDPATGRAIPGNATERATGTHTAEQQAALAEAMPHLLQGAEVPQALPIDTMDFLKDPETPTLKGSTWAAHGTWLRPDDVRALQTAQFFRKGALTYLPRFLPSAADRMDRAQKLRHLPDQTGGIGPGPTNRGGRASPDLDEWWQVWEIHDFRRNRIVFILPGTAEPLRDVPVPPELAGCPYVAWSPTRNGRTFWTVPYAHHYLPAQDVLDRVVSDAVQNFAQHRKKLFLTNGEVDEGKTAQFAQAVNGEIIQLKGDLESIKEIDLGGLPPEYPQMIGLLQGIVHRISGQPELTVGQTNNATATENRGIQQFHLTRLQEMETDLNDAFAQVAERMVRLAATLAPPEVVVPILGTEVRGWERVQERFKTVRRAQLARPFRYRVLVGAGAERLNQLRQAQLLQVWNHLAPILPPEGQRALAAEILYAFDLRPTEILGSAPAPVGIGAPGAGVPGAVIPTGRGAVNGAASGPTMPGAPMQSADANTRGGPPDLARMLTESVRAGGARAPRGMSRAA